MKFSNLLSIPLAIAGSIFFLSLSAQSGDNCANAIPLTVNVNECSFTPVSNSGLTNSGQTPVGASCNDFAGGDLWLSVVMPPSGEMTITTQLIPLTTPGAMDINMAVYSGPCAGLLLVTCDDDSGLGFFAEATFSGIAGQTYYVQLWETNNNTQGTFNICANGSPTCTAPTATFTRQCAGNSEYNVEVNITSLGDAASVNITNDGGAPAFNGLSSTGTQIVGPFALGTDVNVTVEHGSDPTCNVSQSITAQGIGCERILDCSATLNETYCYQNNDNSIFLYSSPDGSPVTLAFVSGLIENGIDNITIRDGDNGTAPVLFTGSSGGDLAGVTEAAQSGSIYMQVNSDGAASCEDNSFGLGGGWEWTVECEGCDAPVATFNVIENCAASTFSVEVNITSLGNASSLSITNDAAIAATTGISTTGIQIVGPFNAGIPVEISVLNEQISDCALTQSNLNSNCPDTDPCADATELISQTTFAESEINADLADGSAGTGQCVGPGDNSERYFSFEAVGSVTYIRVEASGDFDPAVEVFDACGGNQLACVNDAGEGVRELFWVSDLTPGNSFTYRVFHAGGSAPATTAFATAVAHIPQVQLRNDFCDATDLNTLSIIRATSPNPDFLLESFTWEFTELEAPFNTYEVVSPNGPNPQFRMFWFPEVEFGRSYEVRVRALMYQGPNLGDYGPSCTITMAAEPQTALRAQFEGGSFNMCDLIRAEVVPGAENYRWTFDDGQQTLTYNSESANVNCPLRNVQGLQLGTQYNVQVFATVTGIEGTVSTPRSITMNNFVPDTEVNNDQIECGSTVDIFDVISAVEVCAVEAYTFRFTEVGAQGAQPIEFVRPNRVLRLNQVPGLVPGSTYSVQVRATSGGLEGTFAESCELTIAGNEAMVVQLTSEQALSAAEAPTMSIYPNPTFDHEIMITFNGMTDEYQAYDLEVYNMAGQKLYVERFGNQGSQGAHRLRLPSGIAEGAYLIRASANGVAVGTQKIFVR